MAASQNPQQATSLVIDEFMVGMDSVLATVGGSAGMNNSALQANLTANENSINQNPLSQTPDGQLLGSLVYDLTVMQLSSNGF